jgi:hypothetical protein
MWHCDGTEDCTDGSGTFLHSNFLLFILGWRQFSFSWCLLLLFVLDDSGDCQTRVCGETEFRCNTTGRCIPSLWVCDGNVDCSEDGSDENPSVGCSPNLSPDKSRPACHHNEFRCLNRRCVLKVKRESYRIRKWVRNSFLFSFFSFDTAVLLWWRRWLRRFKWRAALLRSREQTPLRAQRIPVPKPEMYHKPNIIIRCYRAFPWWRIRVGLEVR